MDLLTRSEYSSETYINANCALPRSSSITDSWCSYRTSAEGTLTTGRLYTY